EVKRRLATPSLFGDGPPPGELRAVKVVPNEAAQREKFVIPTNMRVPPTSVIYRLFTEEAGGGGGRGDLSWWESRGKKLDGRAVAWEARRVADRVIAVVQPVEPVRQQPQGPKVKELYEE